MMKAGKRSETQNWHWHGSLTFGTQRQDLDVAETIPGNPPTSREAF